MSEVSHMPSVQRYRLDNVRARVCLRLIVPWFVCGICLLLVWLSPPPSTHIAMEDTAWRSGFYPVEQAAYRWTAGAATLRLWPQTVGAQQVRLSLQSGRDEIIPVQVQLGSHIVELAVDPHIKTYDLVANTPLSLQPLDIKINSATFQPPNDARELGVIVSGISVVPLAGGVGWRLILSCLLLVQVAVLFLAVPRRWSVWLRTVVVVLGAPLVVWLVWPNIYDVRGVVIALQLLGLTGLLAIVTQTSIAMDGWSVTRQLKERWRDFVMEQPDITITPWNRSALLTGCAIAGIVMATRVLMAPSASHYWAGDDYLVGVFAFNVLRFDLPLYYGHHTGTLASYLTAPFLALFGPTPMVLAIVPVVLASLLALVLFGLGRDLFGVWGGIAASLWLIFPPAILVLWTLRLQPGYLEAITCAMLALWGTVRLLWGQHTRRTQVWLMAGIGVAATLALWTSFIVASFALTCVLASILAWRRLPALPWPGYTLLIALPILGWLLPLVIYVVRFPNYNPIWWMLDVPRPDADPSVGLSNVVRYQIPLLLTNRFAGFTLIDLLILGVAALAFGYFLLLIWVRRHRAALLVVTLTGAILAAYVFSSFSYLQKDIRYILPLMAALPLALGGLLASVRRIRHGRWIGIGLVVAVLCANVSTWPRLFSFQTAFADHAESQVADYLVQSGLRYIHTSYWIAMPVMFESGGQVVASAMVGPARESYDPRNEVRVLAAGGVDTAFVFRRDGVATQPFERYLDEHEIGCQRVAIEHFMVYSRCAPLIDVADLGRVLPEAQE
ncbi:MAG: hypothetical protein GFH27_549313n13 [Chloroflexi bacterium AL-W]|nr:hypothetical protein [Chloroflexi bacterium AL-N1]NOK69436.1 hypothetical protein [Chloroflexi bacterium AL-N10]NOK77401.1 hypothetical protein [Chloroflexi bacterium AL-N5]NOK84252.1 hypothetical protein [Chloroflexi bacterium AL-W]NOK91583.1 hypothetical protein [Chloroflexi bacterium AL-N15]